MDAPTDKGKGKTMAYRPLSWIVALDGGTTNTRARLVHDGRIVATARRSIGARDAALSTQGARQLAAAVRDSIAEVLHSGGGVRPDAVVVAGMLTSEAGIARVPHVAAPAGIAELAAAAPTIDLPEVADAPMLFVPGVRTLPTDGPDGWADADLMRGEECETLGALELVAAEGQAAFLWPGSHTKLVLVDSRGRIECGYTTLAGEMTTALARHTLIAASLPEVLPDDPDAEAFEAGVRLVERDGLGRCAFLVRLAALNGGFDIQRRAAFWVGAVIGEDVVQLVRHPILHQRRPVYVGGTPTLRRLYCQALAVHHDGPVRPLTDEDAERASAVGALAIARRARERRH